MKFNWKGSGTNLRNHHHLNPKKCVCYFYFQWNVKFYDSFYDLKRQGFNEKYSKHQLWVWFWSTFKYIRSFLVYNYIHISFSKLVYNKLNIKKINRWKLWYEIDELLFYHQIFYLLINHTFLNIITKLTDPNKCTHECFDLIPIPFIASVATI